MAEGIILKSASHEVSEEQRQKNLAAVVEAAGYEAPEPEVLEEPKRETFKTDEEFEAAHVAWQDKQKAPEVEEEEEEAEATPKKPSRKERAIARATEKLQRENEELRRELEAAKGKTEPPKDTPKPKRTDFADDEAFEDALVKWGVAKAEQEKAVKDVEDAKKARATQVLTDYFAQVEEAKEAHEDWDELFEALAKNDITIGHAAQNMIFQLENGAEVSYYLARHPVLAKKLGQIDELLAVAEVVRLSDRLKTGTPAPSSSDDEEKPTKPKPKVPAPVRTVSTAGSSTPLSFKELAEKPDYPGKARDLRKLAAQGR